MPATQNYRLAEWDEPPALTGVHLLNTEYSSSYRPASFDDCVAYVLEAGLSELTAYDGYPEKQLDFARDISSEIYEEGIIAENALAFYLKRKVREDRGPFARLEQHLRLVKETTEDCEEASADRPYRTVIVSQDESNVDSELQTVIIELHRKPHTVDQTELVV